MQLSASAIPEYTRNSAVLAIYGNQNNYLMVSPCAQTATFNSTVLFDNRTQGIGKLYSQLIFYIIFVVASFLALIWGAVIPCFRKVGRSAWWWWGRSATLLRLSVCVCVFVLITLLLFNRAQNRPSNLDEMMASVKVPGRK